jgi:hypothetical protein
MVADKTSARKIYSDDFVELLAELEHEQWRFWRKEVEEKFKLPHSPLADKAYSELKEAEKEGRTGFGRARLSKSFLNACARSNP